MDYIQRNKALWDARTEVHYDSSFYNVEAFVEGRDSLNSIEIDLLGDVRGLKVLHLQCHFGQDSISLARRGAHVTAVDFSEIAIAKAKELQKRCGTDVRFLTSDVFLLNVVLDETFDIVFTSYGVIGWLPDMEKWASVIKQFLKPDGKLVFVEFHPVVWMFDSEFLKIEYAYAQKEAIVELEEGTYTDREAPIKHESVTWNHSLSEVIGALLRQNLQIETFQEFDYSPYNCFANMEEIAPYKFQIQSLKGKIPMVYSLVVRKGYQYNEYSS